MDAQRSEIERTGLLLSHAMRGHCPDLLAVTIDDNQDLLQRISLSTKDHPTRIRRYLRFSLSFSMARIC